MWNVVTASQERQGTALARCLPNARIAEITGAGHMLHHTHPEHALAAVREVHSAG